MGKYDPLGDYLRSKQTAEVPMTFADIEQVIGASLPPASERHPAWWSNNPSNNVMTKVWLDAGYRTERLDLGGRRLVFRRAAAPKPKPMDEGAGKPKPGGIIAALRLALGGTVRMAAGVDITTTGEVWDAERQ